MVTYSSRTLSHIYCEVLCLTVPPIKDPLTFSTLSIKIYDDIYQQQPPYDRKTDLHFLFLDSDPCESRHMLMGSETLSLLETTLAFGLSLAGIHCNRFGKIINQCFISGTTNLHVDYGTPLSNTLIISTC